jgi:hypothetical protein
MSMTYVEAIEALTKVRNKLITDNLLDDSCYTKGGYFRVGNVAIKIAEITEIE